MRTNNAFAHGTGSINGHIQPGLRRLALHAILCPANQFHRLLEYSLDGSAQYVKTPIPWPAYPGNVRMSPANFWGDGVLLPTRGHPVARGARSSRRASPYATEREYVRLLLACLPVGRIHDEAIGIDEIDAEFLHVRGRRVREIRGIDELKLLLPLEQTVDQPEIPAGILQNSTNSVSRLYGRKAGLDPR